MSNNSKLEKESKMTNAEPWGHVRKTSIVHVDDVEWCTDHLNLLYVTDVNNEREFSIDVVNLEIDHIIDLETQLIWGIDEFKVEYDEFAGLVDKGSGEPKRELVSIEKYREYTYLEEGGKHRVRFKVVS